jgi:hypothetical protein
VLLEWFGATIHPTLVGEPYGMKDLNVLPSGTDTRGWIDDYWLSRSKVEEKIREKCGNNSTGARVTHQGGRVCAGSHFQKTRREPLGPLAPSRARV